MIKEWSSPTHLDKYLNIEKEIPNYDLFDEIEIEP